MKTIAATLVLVLAATPALAISRYNPLTMTCEKARATVHRQGAVIFRWTSPRGLPIYDRFVRNNGYCDYNQYAEWKNIPTRDDRTCPVLNCQSIDNLDGTFIIPNRHL
ncbi:MAG TPA: hypothetical protein VL202_05205 [Pararhizobium sp.]|uniref:hypothetical protein n=1 Tax=Pararhizobium sp. TaxID=1977563 RepID=UPI002CDE39A5|nr:hypothetical protein [Pararhizobium sp.]HTO30562.1 hypothetical protein [Pararhizobium sp.]